MGLLCISLPMLDRSLPFLFYQLVFADTILVYVLPLALSPIIMINCEQKLITGTSEMALVHATLMGLNWNPLVCF